jgi:hypothetical protein
MATSNAGPSQSMGSPAVGFERRIGAISCGIFQFSLRGDLAVFQID